MERIKDLQWDLEFTITKSENQNKLLKQLREFDTYIRNNQDYIPKRRTVPEWGTHRDQLCGIDSEPVGEQADGEAATNAMDGKRGAPIAANADQSVEWGVGGDVPALVPKVSTRNGGNARGTQAGRWLLVLSKVHPVMEKL